MVHVNACFGVHEVGIHEVGYTKNTDELSSRGETCRWEISYLEYNHMLLTALCWICHKHSFHHPSKTVEIIYWKGHW